MLRRHLQLARGEELVAIEVKASTAVERRDLMGIEACEQAFGKRLRLSVILYRSDQDARPQPTAYRRSP